MHTSRKRGEFNMLRTCGRGKKKVPRYLGGYLKGKAEKI